MRRYLELFAVQVRASLLLAMQYRSDFVIHGTMAVFWAAMALIPLRIVFSGDRQSVAGWTYPEALVVLGWFTLLKAVLEGAINPSLLAVVEHIRKGTLDFVLLKPADAQFLVSTSRIEPWRIVDALAALGIFWYAFHRLGRTPSLAHVALSLGMVLLASLVLYSLWILVISAAFYVVRIDNLSYLFTSIYDAARWPITVFQGALRFVFTFVIPLALMTTFPAMALLGKLGPELGLGSVAGAAAFAALSRAVWRLSLSRYTSASS
jgi:ABC-2 type transport system permease protein